MRTISKIVRDNEKSMFLYDCTSDFESYISQDNEGLESEELRRKKEYFLSDINLDISFILDFCCNKGMDVFIYSKKDDISNIISQCSKSFITPRLVSRNELKELVEKEEKISNSCFIFYRSFRGMTNEDNKTFKIIKKAQDVFSKSVYVDAVTKEFLYLEYFPTTLKLLDYDNVDVVTFEQGMEVLTNDFLYDRISIVNEGIVIKPNYSMFDVDFYGCIPYNCYADDSADDEPIESGNNVTELEEGYVYNKIGEMDIIIPNEELEIDESEKILVNEKYSFVVDNLDSCQKLLDIILNENESDYVINGVQVDFQHRGWFFPRSELKTVSNFTMLEQENFSHYNFFVKQYCINTVSLLKYLKRTFSNGLTSKLIFTFILDIDYWE